MWWFQCLCVGWLVFVIVGCFWDFVFVQRVWEKWKLGFCCSVLCRGCLLVGCVWRCMGCGSGDCFIFWVGVCFLRMGFVVLRCLFVLCRRLLFRIIVICGVMYIIFMGSFIVIVLFFQLFLFWILYGRFCRGFMVVFFCQWVKFFNVYYMLEKVFVFFGVVLFVLVFYGLRFCWSCWRCCMWFIFMCSFFFMMWLFLVLLS